MFNKEPTDEELADACMWYRHDFGLLADHDKRLVMFIMREHWLAIWKACNTPGCGAMHMPSNVEPSGAARGDVAERGASRRPPAAQG